jgi:hypothetical protein
MTFPVIASFTRALEMPTNALSLLWLLPLALAGVVVYKALTIRKITAVFFLKEVFALLAFLIGLLIIITLILFVITWIAT